jgi:PAS domain S-box-containing protein
MADTPPIDTADSAVRRLLQAHDWRASPLGAPASWPPALATAVSMTVSSAFPMFVAWGDDLTFLYNDAYIPILGDKHPAAFGKPFKEVWAEIWPDIVPSVDRALAGLPVYFEDFPLFMERKGYREQAWFTFSYAPLHDAHGRAVGLYCTNIETTARVQAERRSAFELALAERLRPLQDAAEAAQVACALLGEELGLARVVYGAAADAGFTVVGDWQRHGLSSQGGRELALDAFGPDVAGALRAGTTTVADVAWGGLDQASCLLLPLLGQGRLQALLVLALDRPHRWNEAETALARKVAAQLWATADAARVQSALRVERDHSQMILDAIAEGFVLIDRNWIVLQMNAAGQRMANRSAAEAVGRHHWDVWPEALDTPAGRMYHHVMRDRIPGRTEFLHQEPGRKGSWFEVRAYPSSDGGLVCFFLDISERKEAEEKLRAADQRKDEFLAMLAHELRNPLAPISAAADLLRIGRIDEARVRQSSAIIGRQVRHMTSLVDDLLDVSRVTRGQVTLARVPVAARTIVDEAIEQVRPMFEARRQHLDVRIGNADAAVLGDKARLVQVLANLLNNAAKYSPEASRIAVTADTDAVPGRLLLTVRDQGIGMEPELTRHVFDLFTQAQRSSDRSQGGLGLGLALVRNLVELHGGNASCASAGLGQGSSFTVELPLMQSPSGSGAAEQAGAGAAAGTHPLRLLVVDDNVDAAATLAMLLEACGYEAAVENASLRALERARSAPPDAALLDIGLPEMDGNELARRLRNDPRTAAIKLIAVTGYGQEQDRRTALEAGFDHHLVKPVDMDKLGALLAGIEAGRGSAHERG